MKAYAFVLFLILFRISVYCQTNPYQFQLNPITTAVSFLNLAPDARSAGMGDVGVATSADAYAMHWNTSKTVFSEHKSELGFTYSPWLRGLVDDITLSTLSGYSKIGNRHAIGGSITYFNLGFISLGPVPSSVQTNPKEFSFLAGYAFQINKKHAVGINGKYVRSNLVVGSMGATTGQALATDLSYFYQSEDIKIGSKTSALSFGVNLSNLGNKMTYSAPNNRDFIPANLRLGSSLLLNLKEKHVVRFSVDFNKLLVPTPPITNDLGQIISGKNNVNAGALVGMIQSFYDAPGIVTVTGSGTSIEPGSRLKEEVNEVTIGGGGEYIYDDFLTFRLGYFHENALKGRRKFITSGVGVKWRFLEANAAHYISVTQNNPLSNVVRFSLLCKLK